VSTETVIISLGGSLISPEFPDTAYLAGLRSTLKNWYAAHPLRRVILITGGGGPARRYQNAARDIFPELDDDSADWIGIRATRLNGELVKAIFGSDCGDPVVCDPTANGDFTARVLVASGWKPGFSTDFDAVLMADRYGAKKLINLSNVTQVHTADPKHNPDAKPLDSISWGEFQLLVGTSWTPGANLPFDPIATARARELGLEVIVAGSDLSNLTAILLGDPFLGTKIHP